jgi:hypothetical protein
MIALFVLPPTAFAGLLGRFKGHALFAYGALAGPSHRAIERRWTGQGEDRDEASGLLDAPSRSDPAAAYEAAR